MYSALVEDIIDGKLWVDVPVGAAQSSEEDGQGNVSASETWQVATTGPGTWHRYEDRRRPCR